MPKISFHAALLAAIVFVCSLGISAQRALPAASERVTDPAERSKKHADESKMDSWAGEGSSNIINATTYPMTVLNGVALEDMSSGTTQLLGPSLDDNASAVTNMGFDFWFDGVRHNLFSVNANGLARLGASAVTTAFNNGTGFATTTNAPKIAPYFEDMCTGSNGKVHYKVVGSAPNRKLVVEWTGMQVTRGAGCVAAPGTGTFQMWLFESESAANPGAIQFVYGEGIGASAAEDAGATIGFQSGAATNFASVTVSDDSVSYTTANNTNAAGIAEGKSYVFTPNVPAAPTGLNFAPVTQVSIQLNWTDNANNELGYLIYRSTDGGATYSFLALTAADATSYNDTGLVPGTTYFYRVSAVTEGALSGHLWGSQATGAPGEVSCAGAGGNWSSTATWTGGSVPLSGDNVTIGSGCTVTIDTDAAVALNVTIASGGTLQSPLTGEVTNNNLTIGGSLTNNGILDLSTNGDTSGAILTFSSTLPNATFGGSGATTDVRAMVINKGAQTSTLEVNPTNFTVRGASTDGDGFITLTTGTLKISGTFTLTHKLFSPAAYIIPVSGGLWIDNPNLTVVGQNGSPTLNGLFRMTQGTYNIGTGSGNSMGFASGSRIIVEGGAINATGRFGVAAAGNAINYTQTGGTITVQTVGNASTTLAGFDMGTSTASIVKMSGGTIVVQLANTSGSGPRDYRHQSGSIGIADVTGGTLQLGNANSGAAKTFNMRGVVPNLVIDNTSAGHTGQWDTNAVTWNNISRNITINPGTTLNPANIIFLFAGTTLTNNGTLIHNGASSRFYFFGSGALAPQTYTGSGGIGGVLNSFEFDNQLGVTLDPSVSTINTNRVILFSGNVTNSDKITVGSGGTSAATVQIGNTTTPTAAGTFDSQMVFNPGSGGVILSYLRTTMSRTTGGEIPSTRTITNMTYDDNDPTHTLTIAGGDLTVTGTLSLTNGVIVTGANTLVHNGGVVRTAGYVDGNLRRDFAATGSYTFHTGQNGYSPVAATVNALGTTPSSLTVRAIDETLAGLNPAASASRSWALTETGDLTADLSFIYNEGDVNGDESAYKVYRLDGGTPTDLCGASTCVSPGSNTGAVTGISTFGQFGIGVAGGGNNGTIQLSSAAYSAGEGAGQVTITATRTGGSSGAVSVAYTTSNGSATSTGACGGSNDYGVTVGTFTWADGDTADKTVNVPICDDAVFEGDESFNFAISNPTGGATVGTPASAVVTITDNEAEPAVVQFGSATYSDDESQTATLTVTRGGDTSGPATVNYSFTSGTAVGAAACGLNVDFVSSGGTLTFGAGETTGTITVQLCADSAYEVPGETFTATLSSTDPNTVIGGTASATVTINDTAADYRNADPIALQDNGPATPYPSTINVSGAAMPIAGVRVTLYDVTVNNASDLDVLLVGPQGQQILLMADAGGNGSLGGARTLTFSDAAGQVLPQSPFATGEYEPTSWEPGQANFPAPAPAGPYNEPGSTVGGTPSLGSVFGGSDPNGTWSLYVRDDDGTATVKGLTSGQIAGGWGIQFGTQSGQIVSMSGRALSNGRAAYPVFIEISGGDLAQPINVVTNSFGYYTITGLTAGQTYNYEVTSRRYNIANSSGTFTAISNVFNANFVASPKTLELP